MTMWLDITTFAPTEGGVAAALLARAILENGTVRLEGDASVVAQLQRVVDGVTATVYTMADGQSYLEALTRKYRSPAMLAGPVQSGTLP